MVQKKVIAIDGPAGAGKSTIAKAVAKKLGYLYIDTGAMYRAIGWGAVQAGISMTDEAALTKLAKDSTIELKNSDLGYQVFLNGADVTEAIRTPAASAAASPVSAVLGVREELVPQQRRLAAAGQVVMDGRDIGTNVLPQADCKIFLTAATAERAHRRYLEFLEKGVSVDLAEVERDMAERDHRDSHREHAPLKQAADAYLLDSTGMSVVEVVEKVLQIVGE
ncbi:MAG: (d)CMP kinase [Clostridiales bacterium]